MVKALIFYQIQASNIILEGNVWISVWRLVCGYWGFNG